MQPARHDTQAGFSLLQLSIALVIMGLLVGGTLTGRDLINNAIIRSQISQIEKYNTAVGTFQNKYGGLPGDLRVDLAIQFGFNTSGSNGSIGWRDGNGFIDGYCNGCGNWVLQAYGETVLFWQDLSQANMIDGTFPNSGATSGAVTTAPWSLAKGTTYIGDYFPTAKIGQGNFMYVYDGQNNYYQIGSTWYLQGGDNWYGLSAMTSVLGNGGMTSNPAMTVQQAYNIDKKMDDGLPTTGNVQALYLSGWVANWANSQATDSTTSCYNTTTNTYSISKNGGNGMNCALSFQFQH